jgi:hypothetical protein
MLCTTCLVCLVNTDSGHCKNAFGRGSASSEHITNLCNLFSLDIYAIDSGTNVIISLQL